jgi:signal peptide peptidase SppA
MAPGVAVIPIHGTLVRRTVGLEAESGLTSYTALAAQLDAALADPAVAAILLDIDSPGGESGGVFDLADRIRAASQIKPVWAVANDMAFSAAYALASAASKVFVSRTGGVGSIGVIAMHVDQSEKDALDGVRYTAVFAGDRKNDLNPHEPISGEAHAFLKAEVHRIYSLFVETVARHRGIEPALVRDTEAGLFFGQAAVAIGLADALGTFEDALTQLAATVSPRPMAHTSLPGLVAGTGPVRPSDPCPSFPMESLMNEPNDTPVTDHNAMAAADAPASDPNPPSAIEPMAASTAMAAAIEIAQTCTLAGRTDLIAGFLEAQASPAQVRSQLLAAQADASPEIVSRIDPLAAAVAAQAGHPASPHNPLVQAVKSRLGQH